MLLHKIFLRAFWALTDILSKELVFFFPVLLVTFCPEKEREACPRVAPEEAELDLAEVSPVAVLPPEQHAVQVSLSGRQDRLKGPGGGRLRQGIRPRRQTGEHQRGRP